MSWELDATDWTRQLSSPLHDGNNPKSLRASIAAAISMSLSLTTAGRLGFFIDYSELSDAGTHTFYVARTHGSTGAVSVAYATSGDGHTSVSGVLSWADEDMSIQSFTVAVTPAQLTNHQTTLGLGEHRIVARLSNPTNSAVLHFGTEETKAYGVIDNNVLASDANAVFFDADATTNGAGTQSNPYNNYYDARDNVSNKRYIYGKGTLIANNSETFNGSNVFFTPSSRASESQRLYIRNWSGNSLTVTSSVSNLENGFYSNNLDISFHTYKGIRFADLNCSASIAQVFGVHYRYADCASINIEGCTGENLNGNTGNNALFTPYGVDGFKMWDCNSNGIALGGDQENQNTAMMVTFQGKNGSVQKCTATNSYSGIYHKQTTLGDVSTSVRFCNLSSGLKMGVRYSTSGGLDPSHSFTLVQSNIIKGATDGAINHASSYNDSLLGGRHFWCNNTIDSCGVGEVAAIHKNEAFSAQIFNNIFLNCRKVWANFTDNSLLKTPDVEYADFNCEFGTILLSQKYEYRGVNYSTASALNTAFSSFAGNDINQSPLFTNAALGDYTLQAESPALTSGVDGTQQGVYLGDFYTIGASN